MALIRRVSRLFTADLHAVLDQIEEPRALLKQAIREMEEDLAKQLQRIKWHEAEIEAAATRSAGIDKSLAEAEAKLDLCFSAGNEELARKLIRRRLHTVRLRERLADRRKSLAAALAELESSCADRRDQLEGMRQKAELFAETVPPPGGDWHAAADADPWIGDDEVEVAFLREKQARSGS